MPFTPFHFGPGALVHAVAPRHVSFVAFCAANVAIDVEPLVWMLRGEPPLHRFAHSFVGALAVALAAPWSDANPFLRVVTLDVLHGACVVAALAGIVLAGVQRLRSESARAERSARSGRDAGRVPR